jgi:recombination protein RecA
VSAPGRCPASASPAGPVEGSRAALVRPVEPTGWRLATFVGRLGEISGTQASSPLTFAFRLVLEAQHVGEPVVWIGGPDSVFFPPDVASLGVDLAALPVVRARDLPCAMRAADRLLRSGGFGLAVLDLGANGSLPFAAQTRLSGLARKHHAAVVCLTEKDGRRPSLGSLVSWRVETARIAREGDRYRCEARALKDKRRRPGWSHVEVCRGPDGLC